MTDTVNLGLPCIEGSQAQKHVTHNDALRILDTLVQLAVLDRDLSAPPVSPAEGERWIVKSGATGAWTGHDNAIAAWQDGGWQFSMPQLGWCAFVADEGTLLAWNGAAWGDFFSTVTSIQNLALLGIGTAADSTNVLSAKLNNALFAAKTVAEGGSGDLRYKLSKAAAANTLSFLFQDNFSGRAEIGLAGDDDFHFKVSSDGTTWTEGIRIAATGKVSFPASGGPRELLTANRTYYVRTDGSDSNSGLANTSGGAFLTLQAAANFVFGNLDLAGFTVTIQIGDGTYTGGVSISGAQVGVGSVVFNGNNATPANVVISTTSADCFLAQNGAFFTVQTLRVQTATSGFGLNALLNGTILFSGVDFGVCAGSHIQAQDAGSVKATGNYTISGGAARHLLANGCGAVIRTASITVTLTGTPAFASQFAFTNNAGCIVATVVTYAGTGATGQRYNSTNGGVIQTGGGGANYFPGNAAGAGTNQGVAPWGLYV